jgi:phage shock protein E
VRKFNLYQARAVAVGRNITVFIHARAALLLAPEGSPKTGYVHRLEVPLTKRDETAHRMVAEGALLLDVRTPGEFAGGHVDGAVNIPLDQLPDRLKGLKKEQPVVVYCRSGGRSTRAAALLKASGVQNIHNMGGVASWEGGFSPATYLLPVLLCVTLGMAPFSPEPHLVGKLRWVAGGAVDMGLMDWGDLLMHGAPFVWLAMLLVREWMPTGKA